MVLLQYGEFGQTRSFPVVLITSLTILSDDSSLPILFKSRFLTELVTYIGSSPLWATRARPKRLTEKPF